MKDETRTFYATAVLRALERVAHSLDETLELEALAKTAALSTFHFHRVFRGLVGETPLELHRRLRIERAAEQLCTTSRTITAIGFDAGYETHEAFTRAFRQAYGSPPSAFRERQVRGRSSSCHELPIEIAARCGVHFKQGAPDLSSLAFVKQGAMKMNVVIETQPKRRLATVRHVGPYPEIAEAFHRLGSLAAAAGLYAHAQPAMLALYYDDPETTPAAELRSDAALIVLSDVELPSGVGEATLPAGRYAKTTHRGSYSGLGDTWARLMGEWLPKSGHRVGASPSYEIYVNDPRTTATEDLQTDIYVPLAD